MQAPSGYSFRVKHFGICLNAVREDRDLTQVQVAKAGATTMTAQSLSNYISRIERGDEVNPSFSLLEQIAKGLGLTLSAFFLQIEHAQKEGLQSTNDGRTMLPSPRSHREEATAHVGGGSDVRSAAALSAALDELTSRLEKLERVDVAARFTKLERALRRGPRQVAQGRRQAAAPGRKKSKIS